MSPFLNRLRGYLGYWVTSPVGRMSPAARHIYASGSLGGNAIGRTRDLWLFFFYVGGDDGDPERRVAFGLLTVALVVGRLIEAFDDPLIGYWSDRTRSRLGRRIPFVLAATPFMCIFFVLVWIPPNPGETIGNLIYLFAIFWAFNLFSTLSGGPMESLLPEIARRADDRLSVVSFQVVFGVVGSVLALVVSGLLIDAVGFVGMAIVIAAVSFVSRYVALTGAWRRSVEVSRDLPPEEPRERIPLRIAIATCLRNDQFVYFLPSFILYSVGVQIITSVLPFYAEAVLGKDEPGTTVSILTGSAIAVVIIALPFAVRLARRRSKREVYRWGMLFAGLYFPLFAMAGFLPGIPVVAQGIGYALLVGLALAPVQTFPNALIADITDYDTVRTGQRREATYYATQATLEKIAGAAGPGLLYLLLLLGKTADDPLGIRLVGPVAGVLALTGYFVFRRYWLPDVVTEESIANRG